MRLRVFDCRGVCSAGLQSPIDTEDRQGRAAGAPGISKVGSMLSLPTSSSPRSPGVSAIRLSEVVAALSYALDLTEGQAPGHAARSCLIGMRVARQIRLSSEECSALFYALLLKDLGCSSNASKLCYLFGADDRAAKQSLKTVEWTSIGPSIGYIARTVAPGGALWHKIGRFMKVALAGRRGARELIQLRCDRGATIARDLQLPRMTSQAIGALDEHWDGQGYPEGLRGDAIPLLGRILGLAQTIEVFASSAGLEAACEMARERSGTWFDPELVAAFAGALAADPSFAEALKDPDPKDAVSASEPPDHEMMADEAALDRIASGFAAVIDAKSPWTYKHSEGVAQIAAGVATTMGFGPDQVRTLRRAALLHDIGKLGVSNLILDKPGKLTEAEMVEVRKHPAYTLQILRQVAGFRDLAGMAAAHHERLDGGGYHLGLAAPQLSTAARILAVADMYEALAAKRPYRQDLTDEQVMDILAKCAGPGICPMSFVALKTYLAHGGYVPTAVAA